MKTESLTCEMYKYEDDDDNDDHNCIICTLHIENHMVEVECPKVVVIQRQTQGNLCYLV